MADANPGYRKICDIVYQRSGLVLTEEKYYLLDNRLLPLARERGFPNVASFLATLVNGPDEKTTLLIVDALMTHETYFFRDMTPFDELRQLVLPRYLGLRAASKRLRIWSAACSTGQEPYSIAMCILENPSFSSDWKLEIIATDISVETVELAKKATFNQFEVQRGLPPAYLQKYFTYQGNQWQVGPKVQSMVRFAPHNLLNTPPAGLGGV